MPAVPEDVGNTAHALTENMGLWPSRRDIRRAVLRAIMGERRRCMSIAGRAAERTLSGEAERLAEEILAAIQGPTT